MKKLSIFLLAVSLCTGCAQLQTKKEPASTPPPDPSAGFIERYTESRKLEQAVDLLEQGNVSAAAKALGAVVSRKGVRGVTDEALFRLALISMRGGEKSYDQAEQLLRRLKKEYPASPWTLQAAPLAELLGNAGELRQQNRSLKSTNQALTKEVNELNTQIKQLKNLDLELEQKGR